jgi:hypothetical protein
LRFGRVESPLVITAVVVEGRPVAEVAAAYGVSRRYVALGDSYAAGTAIQRCPPCSIGYPPIGYPALLNSESRIELTANAACSGATTDFVRTKLSALKAIRSW